MTMRALKLLPCAITPALVVTKSIPRVGYATLPVYAQQWGLVQNPRKRVASVSSIQQPLFPPLCMHVPTLLTTRLYATSSSSWTYSSFLASFLSKGAELKGVASPSSSSNDDRSNNNTLTPTDEGAPAFYQEEEEKKGGGDDDVRETKDRSSDEEDPTTTRSDIEESSSSNKGTHNDDDPTTTMTTTTDDNSGNTTTITGTSTGFKAIMTHFWSALLNEAIWLSLAALLAIGASAIGLLSTPTLAAFWDTLDNRASAAASKAATGVAVVSADNNNINNSSSLLWLTCKLGGLMISRFLVQIAASMTLTNSTERVSNRVRRDLFTHLLSADISLYDEKRTAELTDSLAVDVKEVRDCIRSVIGEGIPALARVVGGTVTLFYVSTKLSVVLGSTLIPMFIIGNTLAHRLRKLARKSADAQAKAAASSQESLAHIRTVRAFTAEDLEVKKYTAQLNEASFVSQEMGKEYGLFRGVVSLGLASLAGIVLVSGGYLISTGELTKGQVMSFLLNTVNLEEALETLSRLGAKIQRATGAAGRVTELFDQEPIANRPGGVIVVDNVIREKAQEEEKENNHSTSQQQKKHESEFHVGQTIKKKFGSGGIVTSAAAASVSPADVLHTPPTTTTSHHHEGRVGVKGDVVFENVHFSYPTRPHVPVLQGLNLHLPQGKVCAVVGPSGAGKSTVASLLLRYYEPGLVGGNPSMRTETGLLSSSSSTTIPTINSSTTTTTTPSSTTTTHLQNAAGMVRIDGIPLPLLNAHWLRRHIALVPQDAALFATTIRENILYGNPSATQADIEEAAAQANALGFIQALPKGFETVVGERGVSLSGGQRQRIAIARALVRDPAILILDEATSALDAESEGLVQDALSKAMIGRTTLIVAHRLSTIQKADVIYVLSEGKVVESGTHTALLKNKEGLYSALVQRQREVQQ